MHISTPSLLALLATLAPSSAFVIDTYSTQTCSTAVQTRVNTWDNTCATWPRGFKSFRIRTWGGRAQRAYFFAPNNCGSLPDAIGKGYVDSGSGDYVLGKCYHFGGASANAIASYRG